MTPQDLLQKTFTISKIQNLKWIAKFGLDKFFESAIITSTNHTVGQKLRFNGMYDRSFFIDA
jgi:hypothetical protein